MSITSVSTVRQPPHPASRRETASDLVRALLDLYGDALATAMDVVEAHVPTIVPRPAQTPQRPEGDAAARPSAG